MKYRLFFACIACLSGAVFFLPASAAVSPQTAMDGADESIAGFDASITVNADATMRVSERIAYDFGTAEKHGIFRDIPYRYRARGGRFSLRITNISVSDDAGNTYMAEMSRSGGSLHLKIGDPNLRITGRHIYIISYTVDRAINYFADHDELYWNVTGNDWEVPIAGVSATVRIPGSARATETACYHGLSGDAAPCKDIREEEGATVFEAGPAGAGGGLTIVLGMPKGIVTEPTAWERVQYFVFDNWVVGIPIAVFFLMFFIWRRYGRDGKGRGTIIPEYDVPDDLLPSQIGALLDEKVQNRAVSADIIHLAVNGYLTITRLEKKGFFGSADYLLEQIKESDTLKHPIQKKLLESLFMHHAANPPADMPANPHALCAALVSRLKYLYGPSVKDLMEDILGSLVAGGYTKANPAMIRSVFVGIIPFLTALLIAAALGSQFGTAAIASGVASALIIAGFGFFLPARTEKGALAREKILGLKLYLSVAEKDRIAFHNAPEKNSKTFETFLPYAMVLGVEKAWADQFKDIYTIQPSWYNDASLGSFTAASLGASLSGFETASVGMMTAASGGGSGFGGGGSGGGGGGGGGGSW